MKQIVLNIPPIACIMLFSFLGVEALFHHGFYTSHDGEHQLVRQYVLDQGLRDGQIPVRVSRQLYNGFGYPLFVFTYRLPFYLGEVFRLAGASYVDSVKTAFVLSYLASGISMFVLARRWGVVAGTTAALLYVWAPYRFSTLFVRASLGEHVAFVFIPLIFYGVLSLKASRWRFVVGALSLAGLFLSHVMVAQILAIPLALWITGQWWVSKGKARYGSYVFLTALMGVGAAAYYLIPAGYYRQYTQKLNPSFFADHFVTLRQLLYSPWGYAFSMKGTENDGMSFQVGIAQWAAVILAMFGYLLSVSRLHIEKLQTGNRNIVEASTLIIIFFVSIFLMTDSSSFIWEKWKNIVNIDIPWRFLSVATFSSAALGGWAIGQVNRRAVKAAIAVALLGLMVYANRNYRRVNKYIDYPDEQLQAYSGTSNSDNEYRPVWDDGDISETRRPQALISTGAGELTVMRSASNMLGLAVRSDENVRVDMNTLFFPGWTVLIDGQKALFKYAGEGGIMRIDVPGGYHTIEAKYKETGLAKIADGVSLGSLGVMIVFVQKTLKTRRTGETDNQTIRQSDNQINR